MSFRLKTILGIALIEAVLLAVLIATSLADLKVSNEAELVERAQTSARLFAGTTKDAVLSTDLASLETFVLDMRQIPGIVYARVVSEDQGVLAEAGDAALLQRPFLADDEVANVADGVFDTKAPIVEGGIEFGHVEIGVSVERIALVLAAAKRQLASIALAEMILVALFSAVLGIYLTRQLHTLRQAARVVASGDLNVTVPVLSADEVGQVATAFNTMTERLRESVKVRDRYERELEELNRELEACVERRTARLQASNDALEAANQKLKETQSQLVQSAKMASVGQLAAGVAHEINNPIAFIGTNLRELGRSTNGLLEVLRVYERTAPESPEVADAKETVDFDYLVEDLPEIIQESVDGIDRVRDIVVNLKEFSHVGRSEWQSHDIQQCLESTLTIASNQFKHRVTVKTDFAELPRIDCIPSQLNQVFLNLMVNAAQAIDGEGTLTLKTRLENEQVLVEIEDDGCGMPEDVASRIFEPFFTTKPVGDGTGLGLSVSFSIIERHGGTIGVTSAPGEGTCFRISLPLVQPDGADEQVDEDLEPMTAVA